MNMTMVEHVAKSLCKAAVISDPKYEGYNLPCQICEGDMAKCIWKTFIPEANAAIEAVRDYAMLSFRRKPRYK